MLGSGISDVAELVDGGVDEISPALSYPSNPSHLDIAALEYPQIFLQGGTGDWITHRMKQRRKVPVTIVYLTGSSLWWLNVRRSSNARHIMSNVLLVMPVFIYISSLMSATIELYWYHICRVSRSQFSLS